MSNEKITENGAVGGGIKRKHGAGHLLVGKIARLPKSVREQINRRIEDGELASVIVPWLNGLPAVKKVLSAHFGGVEINQKNISNWTSTGYKRWVEKQEFVMELRALSEDATDFTRAAGEKLARGTACIAAAKIVKMLRGMKSEDCTPDQLIKIAYATTALVQAEQNNERLKNEKTRVFQGNERLVLSWDKHMRNCAEIGLRLMDDWQAKAVHEAPFDNTVKIELLGRRMFGHLWRKRKLPGEDHIPGNVGDEEPEPGSTGEVGSTHGPSASPDAPENIKQEKTEVKEGQNWTDGTDEMEAEAKTEPEKTAATQRGPTMTHEAADQAVSATTVSSIPPVNPYAGRSTQEVIAEIEENYAREKAAKLNRQRQREVRETSAEREGCPLTPALSPRVGEGGAATHVTAPKPELSDYEKAILEGKTHLEAMYAQFTPAKKPHGKEPTVSLYPKPSPWDAFSEPVHYRPQPGPTPPFYGPCDPPLSR